MSEYQYYEFLAIDRPLNENEINELRALSTRATITPVSFTNYYNWGDFKGNPDKLMQRYFDAHVYVANWMTAIFMVRLPIEALPKETAEALAVSYMLDFKATKTHWVITWSLEESENYDRFGMEDGRGWMARLALVRDELLRGDMRSLYIGWLAGVTGEMMDDDEMEPVSISGLGSLTAVQQALAEFLEVDPDLIAGAGMGSPVAQSEEISEKDMDRWIDALPRNEVKAVLKQLLEGKGHLAERSIKNRFTAWRRGLQTDKIDPPRRRVGELRENAETSRQIRMENQKRDRKRREIRNRKKREVYLKNLSKDFPKAWKSVAKTVERGSGLAYDEACRALVDISEAYALSTNKKQFQKELKKFMAGHMRRKALIQRLVKAGIWEDQ
ncbi:MAG: hypothetical protein JRF62_14515 [Deltaproteobacteria bacterium]|nr:hypothetical protein [Deltaproteobacteria bacterium]MBW2639052.1 hypothetical protein [Deltaproteobacteria bacterium]MBW2681268.1 hypothetical protein [Deltaproteobacteria bacterium]RLC15629.1 MAG: hypothetical protein DRI24_10475 [Deltaproteobacteria bacterium]